jgi:hypothetical protein
VRWFEEKENRHQRETEEVLRAAAAPDDER